MNPTAEQQALLAVLHAEYAAVFAYGLVAAYSRGDRQDMIATAVAAHRARRDELATLLGRAGVAVPPADPGYTMPFPVDDPIPAAKLAVAVESDTATAWLAAIERAEADPTRRTGIDALTECAVRLADWRAILGVAPPTTAFPGKSA